MKKKRKRWGGLRADSIPREGDCLVCDHHQEDHSLGGSCLRLVGWNKNTQEGKKTPDAFVCDCREYINNGNQIRIFSCDDKEPYHQRKRKYNDYA